MRIEIEVIAEGSVHSWTDCERETAEEVAEVVAADVAAAVSAGLTVYAVSVE